MNSIGDTHLRSWVLDYMILLAADTGDQLGWLGEREVATEDVVEEGEALCRMSEGLTERGAFTPGELLALRAVGRRLVGTDAPSRVGLWGDALRADPAWDDLRPLARHVLVTTLGDWRQPLPRAPRPHTNSRGRDQA
ncbi:hypothetical protein ACF06N_07735 [Streptomyces albidoflavus]